MLNMDDSDARRIAEKMADRLTEPIPHIDPGQLRHSFTLLDILRCGLIYFSTVRQAYPDVKDKFPASPDFVAAFLAEPSDPVRLRDLLYEGLKKSDEDPTALEDEVKLISAGVIRRGTRKQIKEALRQAWPPAPPGSDRKITAEEVAELADRTERLRPVLIHLLSLQQQFPGKDWGELVSFLHSTHPRECTYLRFRIDRLPKLVRLTVFLNAKTIKSKARVLADLLAGGDFELGPRYARQKAEEVRRLVRGKERQRSPRLP